ncbi:MerR family transcriptional regulator [Virgibacillus xinjiangensis]|uniref:MerR family transcriptional regulator n=1 Tax=Virgibacillus xinjiangensis TaxID=393090 RepID=A0ABV7CV57_9BACI
MLKIGELAALSNVSRRTIDYYTKIGLLECERSESNYRFYPEDAMEDIKFIEQCKQTQMTLEQIKQRIDLMKADQVDEQMIQSRAEWVAHRMEDLQAELEEIHASVEKLEQEEQAKILKTLKPRTSTLIQSLSVFSS